MVHGVDLDNRWVVPYNPWLTLKYESYVNVEVCANIKSSKYLFKYVYKGHDCIQVTITENAHPHQQVNLNEISTFLHARYVSPPEAKWHLLEYRMHAQSHTIVRLPVHLPQQQLVYFHDGQGEGALHYTEQQDTMLTAWFLLNLNNVDATSYLYSEIPNHFVFTRPADSGNQGRKEDLRLLHECTL